MNKRERLQISDAELKSFTLAVNARFGLDFTNYEKKSLKRGLVRLINKNDLKSMIGLWGKILRDKGLIVEYIDELLVNLTEFFRNYELWVKMRDDICRQMAHFSQLNLWHAGCSTGEEIYTMAILLKEKFLLHKANIIATDLSTKALNHAKKASYNQLIYEKYKTAYSNYNPSGSSTKYFKEEADGYSVLSQYKKNIEFVRHNLVHDSMEKKFHIIFCRNVMIYFDDGLKMKVLKKFYEALEDKGFFVIGYYDMLPQGAKDMFVLYCPKTRIYKKKIHENKLELQNKYGTNK